MSIFVSCSQCQLGACWSTWWASVLLAMPTPTEAKAVHHKTTVVTRTTGTATASMATEAMGILTEDTDTVDTGTLMGMATGSPMAHWVEA